MDNVKIHEPLGKSDPNKIHFDINVKSESKNKKTYRRNFHKGNYKDMRKYLAKLDWNNMLMNKTAIECWNILKYEIEGIIDKFVPLKKQGKRYNDVINWIEEWLTHRRQRVIVDGEISNWKSILSGVPQGSVLGTIVFLIYMYMIWKMTYLAKYSNLQMYKIFRKVTK